MTSLPDDLLRIADELDAEFGRSAAWKPDIDTLRLAAQALRWVPVEERLPDDGVEVVVLLASEVRAIDSYTIDNGWDMTRGIGHVTHWTPLPEPPQ